MENQTSDREKNVRILLLSTSDLSGGASIAAYRLHKGLQQAGIDSQMLVQRKTSDDYTVMGEETKLQKGLAQIKPILESLPLKLYPQYDSAIYSPQWLPDRLLRRVQQIDPNVINLHWVNFGFVNIETLARFNKPLVWTLHDMWAFTGGCHYSQGCDRYTNACGACPQLGSNKERDLSRWVWQRKAKAWQKLNLTVVTPSRWMAKCALSSSLFRHVRIETIPNGIDLQRYKPIDKTLAKSLLGLPTDKLFILFGALYLNSDPRKGFSLLVSALHKLDRQQWQDRIELAIMGASQPSQAPDFGIKTTYLGKLNDDIAIALAYAAADLFIAPSLEDNLPNTILEAFACGTPCVAFKVGGMPDMIIHQQNGYLAEPFSEEDLARGINWVLEDGDRYQRLRDRARQKVEQEFSQQLQTKRYTTLFSELDRHQTDSRS